MRNSLRRRTTRTSVTAQLPIKQQIIARGHSKRCSTYNRIEETMHHKMITQYQLVSLEIHLAAITTTTDLVPMDLIIAPTKELSLCIICSLMT